MAYRGAVNELVRPQRAPVRHRRWMERLEERILFAVVSGNIDYFGPVPFTRVELFQEAPNGAQVSNWAYTDANGDYSITTNITTGPMELVVALAWDPNQGSGGKNAQIFQITYDDETRAVELDSDVVTFTNTLNADLTDDQWYIFDLVQNLHIYQMLDSYMLTVPFYSFAYFGGFEGTDGQPNNSPGVLGELMEDQPVTMHQWNNADFGGFGEPPSGAYYYDFNIYMHNSIDDSGQWPDNFDSPMNNEWHETAHYFNELLGGLPGSDDSINHGGYSNSDTSDALAEGFAEFLPCQYLRLNNFTLHGLDANFYQYGGGDIDISENYKAWEDEEIALASLLWDLTDESPGGIGMDTAELFDIMLDVKPNDVGGLYAALVARNIGSTGVPLSKLDQAFVDHGFFADMQLRYDPKRDLFLTDAGKPTLQEPQYDEGELIGYAANRNPLNSVERIKRDGLALPRVDIVAQPTKAWSKSPLSSPVIVHIEEADGSLIENAEPSVTLRVVSGGGKLLGTYTVQAVDGVATFNNFQFSAAGNIILQASTGNYIRDTSNPIAVTLPAIKYAFKVVPGTTAAGANFAPDIIVEARDAKNKVVTDYEGDVALSIKTGPLGAILDGTLTVTLVNGVATFTAISTETAGKFSLSATDGALVGSSAKFTITPDFATEHLVLLQSPANTLVGKAMIPPTKVAIQDQFGNVVTAKRGKVQLTIASGPGLLKGPISVTPSSGVATFNKNMLTVAGAYQLKLDLPALADPTPVTFAVTIDQAVTAVKPPTVRSAGYLSTATIALTARLTSLAPTSIVAFTGNVVIKDDNDNTLGVGVLSASGVVKWSLTGLAAGVYTCTVVYDGDTSHTAVESDAFTLKIL